MKMTPDTEESVRCSAPGCSCVCFKPQSVQLRSCDRCGHGWVAHALEKLHLQAQQSSSCGPVEVALPGLVFDLSSLVLYGAQAIPVRLKILLDRLYSVLTPDQVGHILHTLGWSLGDYVRGYMLQHPSGKVLDHWMMVTPEEELLILKQFLRFGETRPIVELMTLQCLTGVGHLPDPEPNPNPKSSRSNINTFIERNGGTAGTLRNTRGDACCLKKNSRAEHNDAVRHLESPGGQSLLLPFQFPNSAFHCLVPATKDLLPPSKLTECLRNPNGTKLVEMSRQEGGRRVLENNPVLQRSEGEPALTIKADPDKPNATLSIWRRGYRLGHDQEVGVQSRHSSTSCSPPVSQKLQGTSSYSFNPLPTFSSSFLCPLPTSSFSSSLRPLPSSLCSLPSLSPAGGRKGRVCCGVCGKSFYDKGTLKIHYNAVHLKIKHRCTVAGCTMVFSSLRSRNRHSANPNPRLHTAAGRDAHANLNTHTELSTSVRIHKDTNVHTRMCRDKEISNTLWQQDEEDARTAMHEHNLRNGFIQHGCQDNTPPQADSPPPSPHPLPRNLSQTDFAYKPQAPPPLLPGRSASLPGSPPFLVPLVEKTECRRHPLSIRTTRSAPAFPAAVPAPRCNSQPVSRDGEGQPRGACSSPVANQQRRWESGDPTPKKKPRKSSMPVKIERGEVEEC